MISQADPIQDFIAEINEARSNYGDFEGFLQMEKRIGAFEQHPDLLQLAIQLTLQAGDYARAFDLADTAMNLPEKNQPFLIQTISTCLMELGREEDALIMLGNLFEHNPDFVYSHPAIAMRLAELQSICGQAGEAIETQKRVGSDPGSMLRLVQYGTGAGLFESAELVKLSDELSKMIRETASDISKDMALLLLSRGLVSEALKEYEKAFEDIQDGNDILEAHYGEASVGRITGALHLCQLANENWISSLRKHAGSPEGRPIFIMGLPYSGASRLSKMLSAHSDVSAISNHSLILSGLANGQVVDRAFSERMARWSVSGLKAIGARYSQMLDNWDTDAERYVSAPSSQYAYIGAIHGLLHGARTITVMRDHTDHAMDIFREAPSGQVAPYSFSLTQAAEAIRAEQIMAKYWAQVLPGETKRVTLNDFVDTPGKKLAEIQKFLNLDPEPENILIGERSERLAPSSEAVQAYKDMMSDQTKEEMERIFAIDPFSG